MENYSLEKTEFKQCLLNFAQSLSDQICVNDEWTVRGFIDVFKNIYTVSSDTKIISKILELHLFPLFLNFSKRIGYKLELATQQNWYPDLTFVKENNSNIKFAVDLKTTYRDEDNFNFCNGFTLGSHGEYFINRNSTKNIKYPYKEYISHFCLGIIYSRSILQKNEELKIHPLDELNKIPSVIRDFTFFVEEKWKIASDIPGSGNTANIGSIKYIPDILAGNGVFSKAGEEYFDDYWINYGKIDFLDSKTGSRKKVTTFSDYLEYRSLPQNLNNPKTTKRRKNGKK